MDTATHPSSCSLLQQKPLALRLYPFLQWPLMTACKTDGILMFRCNNVLRKIRKSFVPTRSGREVLDLTILERGGFYFQPIPLFLLHFTTITLTESVYIQHPHHTHRRPCTQNYRRTFATPSTPWLYRHCAGEMTANIARYSGLVMIDVRKASTLIYQACFVHRSY